MNLRLYQLEYQNLPYHKSLMVDLYADPMKHPSLEALRLKNLGLGHHVR